MSAGAAGLRELRRHELVAAYTRIGWTGARAQKQTREQALKMTTHYDVIVAGGGMVGGLLAAALATSRGVGHPLSVCVLEANEPRTFAPGSSPPYSIRVSAVSLASQRLFESVDAWQGVVDRRACPFRRMRVWDGEADTPEAEHRGVDFDAHEIHEHALGHIVENDVLQAALLERLTAMPSVDVRCPGRLQYYAVKDAGAGIEVRLESGEIMTADLLVGADGARSSVREQAGIDMPRFEYEQRAMVATVSTELPQQDITWQRFMPTGPQAMLPLVGHRASLVWYHDSEMIDRLSQLDDADFISELEGAFPTVLGRIASVDERASFPIAKSHAATYLAERVALVGDACHTVHPLAGQGVNLGMLDAGVLAEVLRNARLKGQDIGSTRTLRRYERWRRGENALMAEVLDGFHKAFSPQALPIRHLRANTMTFAGRLGPARRLITRFASGVAGDLPALARPSSAPQPASRLDPHP